MQMNLVSVIIPSYNHRHYIKQAVESVLSQSYTNLELIVIDDGSTDDTLKYLRTVHDSRYTLIEQPNTGAHNAINRGLSLANGSYLAILNSDDIFHPDRLAECISRLDDGVDLVATWIEIINQKGKPLGVKEGWNNMLPWPIKQPAHGIEGLDEFTLNLLMSNFVSTTSNIVFTRRLYESIGGMRNLRFVHDWDFLLRAARKFRCELLKKPLLQYRTHQTNTISSNRAWMLFEICWIFAVHLRLYANELFKLTNFNAYAISNNIDFLSQSINTQNNDKVFWLLITFFQNVQEKDEACREELVLNDEGLRSSFCRYINI